MKEKIYSEIIIKMKAMKGINQKFVRKALLFILVVKFAIVSNAATYYISNTGNDLNSGLTPALAWKTINKVRSFSFTAGDKILFKSGEVFDDFTLSFLNGGSISNRITISSYGGNVKPELRGYHEILGWTISGNWSEHTTGIWRMAKPTQCFRLWVNGKDKKKSQNLTLTADYPWVWDSGYLYIKSVSNPATTFNSLLDGTRYGRLVNIGVSNLTFKNLKITGGSSASMRFLNCSNITIDSCEVGYRGFGAAIDIDATVNSCDNIIVSNCIIESGDSLVYNYAKDPHTTNDAIQMTGTTNCKIKNNFISNWSHTGIYMYSLNATLPFHGNEICNNYITSPIVDYARALCVDYHSGGYNNSIYNNTMVNMSIGNQLNGNGLKFYNNIIDGIRAVPYTTKVGYGISMSGYATPATNMEIYNNTITNCIDFGIGINWFTGTTIEKSYNNVHDNNLFNNGKAHSFGNIEYQLFVLQGSSTINHNTFTNNHLYSPVYANVVYYGGAAVTPAQFNIASVNSDIISGNDAILKYGNYKTNIYDLRIEHNGTSVSKIIQIDQPMIDQIGNKYLSSVTIQPFSSVILFKDPTSYSIEYKSICEGANYNGWTLSGEYQRTLIAKSGSDSIITTVLSVNPKYAIIEDITINESENYQGWTSTGKYSRKLISVSGCDSIITTNLTVVSSTIKQGSITPTHFIPVWQGENGLNHMNFIVVSASLEDLPLSPEDEIAVFSGDSCVGSSMLSQAINPANNSTFLTFQASQDDGSKNGFTNNDTIQFKIWDSTNQREMKANVVIYLNDVSNWLTSGKFFAGATAVVEIVSYTEFTQSISLVKGYNMISTYLSTTDPNVVSVTKTLNDDGSLIKIQDETGNSFENWGSFGGWINNLGSIQETEGYKIKVANNCTLQVTGRPIALPLDITLKSGWNIISFPRTDFVDAMSIVGSLIDQNKLIKVQDEKGNSIENWGTFGGWKNGIGNFIPGKAYKVKMNADAVLTIQENYTKSAVIMAKNEETEHFSSGVEGNGSDHMNINLIGLTEFGLSVGDELAAYDGDLCVGTLKLAENHLVQNSASLVASFSTDDQNINGFKSGNRIQIYTWNQSSGNESEVQAEPVSGQMNYEKNASVWTKLKSATTSTIIGIEDLVIIDLFPNPSNGKVTVRFSTLPDAGSRIDILDISGRKIATRQVTGTSEEFDLYQQPKGIYLVKAVFGTDELVKKLIIN